MRVFTSIVLAGLFAVKAAAAERYCDEQLGLCFQEYRSPAGIYFRVAVPADAVAPFDVALQIVAPANVGWTGFAWGGQMVNNPLTVAWPYRDSVTVTSRVTTTHALPRRNGNANVIRLKGSGANETHWKANILCQGCSSWTTPGGTERLDTQNEQTRFAWAASSVAPYVPEDPSSAFGYHERRGFFPLSLKEAQQEVFATAIEAARESL